MIAATIALPAGWEDADPDALLDALLAVADGEALACCDRCGAIVDAEDAGESELTGEWICLACHAAEEAEQAAMIAEVHAEMDAMHRARACRDEPVY